MQSINFFNFSAISIFMILTFGFGKFDENTFEYFTKHSLEKVD